MEETDSESRNELFYIREGADERAVTVRELFAELVTGTVPIHTQIRRAAETTAHSLEQDAELSGLLPFYSRKLYARLQGSHAEAFTTLLLFLMLCGPAVFFRTELVYYFISTFSFLLLSALIPTFTPEPSPVYQVEKTRSAIRDLYLLLPYLNLACGPFLYGKFLPRNSLARKLWNPLFWIAYAALTFALALLPRSQSPAILAAAVASMVFFLLLTWTVSREKANRLRNILKASGLPPPPKDPFFTLRKTADLPLPSATLRKYKLIPSRKEALSGILHLILYLALFFVTICAPFLLVQQWKFQHYREKLTTSGVPVDPAALSGRERTFSRTALRRMTALPEEKHGALPNLFRADAFPEEYLAHLKKRLHEHRKDATIMENMLKDTAFREKAGTEKLSRAEREKFHDMEGYVITGFFAGTRGWRETFRNLTRIAQWKEEAGAYSGTHVVRQMICRRLPLASEEELAEYDSCLRASEKATPQKWEAISAETFLELLASVPEKPFFLRNYFRNQLLAEMTYLKEHLIGREIYEIRTELKEIGTKKNINSLTFFLTNTIMDVHFTGMSADLAQIRCLRTLLALERHFRKYARDAETPADLVPEFLEKLPRDPFSGKELRFRKGAMLQRIREIIPRDGAFDTAIHDRTVTGIRVYSVGRDDTDDDGRDWNADGKTETADISFTILRTQ